MALVCNEAALGRCGSALWRLGQASCHFEDDPNSLESLRAQVLGGVVGQVVLMLPSVQECAHALHVLGALDLRIGLYVSPLDIRPHAAPLASIGRLPVAILRDRAIPARGRFLKRMIDIVIAALALIVLSPLLLVLAAAIRIETPGPVLFRQTREGRNGVGFSMLKFRTMRTPAPAAKPATRQLFQSQSRSSGFAFGFAETQAAFAPASSPPVFRQTARLDPRITRVGRVLRRSSLDELPQLLNVLRGEMSLVGPRPHAIAMRDVLPGADEAAPCYAWRHRVRPGMTGLAQIRGSRGSLDTAGELRARLDHDLAYVAGWSLRLDLRIMAATPLALIFAKGRAF